MLLTKVNTQSEVTINSKQTQFGLTGFKIKAINLSTGDVINKDVSVVEVIESLDDPKKSTTAAVALAGTKEISLQDDGKLEDGMVFDDGAGNKYYIEKVEANKITTKVALVADIDSGVDLNQVGNTGIYNVPFTLDTAGKYNVIISNPGANLRNLGAFVEVVENTLDDLGSKIDTGVNYLDGKIDEVKQAVLNSGSQDFEVVG